MTKPKKKPEPKSEVLWLAWDPLCGFFGIVQVTKGAVIQRHPDSRVIRVRITPIKKRRER